MRQPKKNHYVIKRFLLSLIVVLVVGGVIYTAYHTMVAEDNDTQNHEKLNQQDQTEKNSQSVLDKSKDQNEEDKTKPVSYYQDSGTIDEKVSVMLENMTLEEKIGQLMVVGFQSSDPDEHIEKMIKDYHVGGVILFDRNMDSPSQVAELTNQLQDMAYTTGHQIPLTFSVDQEGGSIVRMRKSFSVLPSQQVLGKKGDEEEIRNVAVRTGEQLAAMGFTINFAPVLDLSETDSRSFGNDPHLTGQYGSEVIKGLVEGGVTATVKHFPGNGRSNVDPHEDTSSVEANQIELENSDIYPFKKVIEELNHDDFFVMVTHIKYPAYDKENPASISSIIMHDLLRERLGYTGIVVTDDLEMGAVNKYFTYEDLGCQAVASGADMLLVCHTEENQKKVFNGILNGVHSGKISEERIDEAVQRILTHKYRNITDIKANADEAAEIVGVK